MNRGVAPPATTQPRRSLETFLDYLRAEEINVVFGIPGGLLYPFFDAVEHDPEFQLIVTKHEQGAAFMADGYARTSGRLAVCAATSGPGATNLFTGVACAFADGVPMIVLTGQAASHALGKGAAQETSREDIDIVSMFRPITKYSAMVTTVERLGHHLRRALRLATTGKPGPVHLNVPVDVWDQPLEEERFDPRAYRPESRPFDRNAVQEAAQHLLAARRPALLVGSGVAISGAQEHAQALAELIPARVATTPRGKGLFSEDHPLSLGVLGLAGHSAAASTLFGNEVDVLLTIGASLNETTTQNWHPALRPSRALLQLDVLADPIGRNYPVDVALIGDAQTILVELVYHLHRLMREGERPASTWNAAPSTRISFEQPELRASEAVPVSPQRWRADLQTCLPEDAIVFSDIGGHMLFNIHHLNISKQQGFYLNLGFGSMGHGTVAPIGAALAFPRRPIIAIVGDACLTMNGMELLVAREHNLRVIWIVENNNMHGITWHAAKLLGEGGRTLDSVVSQRPLEVAALARAMGMMAYVVSRPGELQQVMRNALNHEGPTVIEVRVDGSIMPPLGNRVRSLAGFIGDDDT